MPLPQKLVSLGTRQSPNQCQSDELRRRNAAKGARESAVPNEREHPTFRPTRGVCQRLPALPNRLTFLQSSLDVIAPLPKVSVDLSTNGADCLSV